MVHESRTTTEVFSREELASAIARGIPALYRNALGGSDELKVLSFAGLVERLGNKPLPLRDTLDGCTVFSPTRPDYPSGEYPLAHIATSSTYLTQRSVASFGPEVADSAARLWRSLELPAQPMMTNLWIGGTDVGASLHFDQSGNIMAQIDGVKDIYIFDPQAGGHVEFYSNGWATHVVKEIRDYPYEKVELNGGDIFHLPANWLHTTHNRCVSVMVNFWMQDPVNALFDRLDQVLCKVLVEEFEYVGPQELRAIAGAQRMEFLIHKWDMPQLTRLEQKCIVFLLGMKGVQGLFRWLPCARGTRRAWDLAGFRTMVSDARSEIPDELLSLLEQCLEQTPQVMAIARDPRSFDEELDLAPLLKTSRMLDEFSIACALDEMKNPDLRVYWRRLQR